MTSADKVLSAHGDVDALARELGELRDVFPQRVNTDPEHVEQGLAQLVLTLIELLRQLMERQALRRIEQGTLDDEQIERLGETFMKLAQRMEELKEQFGLDDRDLNLDLGPLGTLL
jgi:cob(I)alamin adenosyltransferase